MLKEAIVSIATEVIVSLVDELVDVLIGVTDKDIARARVRGLLKKETHEKIHNVIVRELRS